MNELHRLLSHPFCSSFLNTHSSLSRNRLAVKNCFIWDEETMKDLEKESSQHALQEMELKDMSILEYHTILSLHPTYLRLFNKIEHYLMYETHNIPLRWKYQICILCSSLCNCDYLLATFLHISGFSILDRIDDEIYALYPLLEILARHPFDMKNTVIKEMIEQQHWSICDLLQIISLACHIICLSSFCFSVGLNINEELMNLSYTSNNMINIVHRTSYEEEQQRQSIFIF